MTNLSVPSVIFADASWYGSLRGGIDFQSGNDAQFYDGASRWGIKGSNEVSEGLSAVYRFETGIDTGANQAGKGRLNYVGLSGGFGNLTLGRVWSASYNHAGVIRDFPNWHTRGDTSGRVGNAISYAYSSGAASFQIDAVMDGTKDTGQAVDQLEFGVTVNLGDIGALALAYTDVEDYMTPVAAKFMEGTPTVVKVQKGTPTTLPRFGMTDGTTETITIPGEVSLSEGETTVKVPTITVTDGDEYSVTQKMENVKLTSSSIHFTVNADGQLVPSGKWIADASKASYLDGYEDGYDVEDDADKVKMVMHSVVVDGSDGTAKATKDSTDGRHVQEIDVNKARFVNNAAAVEGMVDLRDYTRTTVAGVTVYTHTANCVTVACESPVSTHGYVGVYTVYNGEGTTPEIDVVDGDVVPRVRGVFVPLGRDDDGHVMHTAIVENVVTGLEVGSKIKNITVTDQANGVEVTIPIAQATKGEPTTQTITIPGTLTVEEAGKEGTATVVTTSGGSVSKYEEQPDKPNYGKTATHVSLQLNLGAMTGALGYSNIESNDPEAMQDAKVTFAGLSGSIGDTGMNWGAWVRNNESHSGKKTTPWTVGLNKSLGDGAKVYIEHGNYDGETSGGEKIPNSTVVGLVVNF